MDSPGERAKLLAAIEGLEAQRPLLGDAVVDPAISALKDQIAALSPATFEAEGERKLVTVMFADASGFTAMSEANDPEYVRNLINGCFEALVPVVEAHGGTIDKFIGDAIMALFGAPIAREDDAERAVRASLAMMKALDTFNRANNVTVGLHFGINTGEVIAGRIGAAGRRDYSVIGDAVNVAARLQDLSKRGQIFVGPETHRLTASAFDYEAMDATALKGRESPVPVFRLMGPKRKPITNVFWKTGYDNPMVGRTAEIERIARAAIELRSGTGQAFIVSGDAGVGKSRLLAEARRHAGLDFAWVQGRAQSHSQNTSYATERELLFGLIGATVDTGPAEAAGLLLGSCHKLMGDEADEVYAHLVVLAGLPVDEIAQPFVQSVSGDALKPRIAKAFLHFVMAWAGKRPLALCFEDIHWVDGATLQLIRDLGCAAKTAPMLLILTARSEALADLALDKDDDPVFESLRLAPLDTKASENLARNFLNCETLPNETLRFLGRRAEGNPFFLEELLRSLVETGALEIKDGRAIATRPITDAAIPTTLQGIIMARMDRLPVSSKATLQTASVIGRTFPLRLLAFVHNGGTIPPTTLNGELKLLEDREFVRRNEGERIDMAEREYVFQHAVTQEVVYGSMLRNRRKTIHLAIAETLENYFGDRSDEFASALALHYREAGEPHRAAQYYLIAARQAGAAFAHDEERACYRNALEQLNAGGIADRPGNDALKAAAHAGLADLLRQQGDHDAARAEYELALSLIGTGDTVLRASIYRKIGMSHTSQRLSADALESSAKAYATLESADEKRDAAWWNERIEVQIERLWSCYWAGDAKLLRETADAARPEIDGHANDSQKSRYFNGVVLIAFREECLNISDSTLACAVYATELARRSNDPGVLTRAYFLIACCRMWRRDLDAAEADFTFVLEQTDHTGDTEWRVMTTNYLALIQRMRGNAEGARRWATVTLDDAQKARMPLYAALSHANLSWLALREGRAEEAGRLASETLAGLAPIPFQVKWLAAWPAVASLHAQGRIAEAAEAVAIMLQSSQNRQPPEIMDALERTATALDASDIPAAEAVIAEILPLAREQGYA